VNYHPPSENGLKLFLLAPYRSFPATNLVNGPRGVTIKQNEASIVSDEQPLCQSRIVTWAVDSSANSKLYAVSKNERREIGLERSVQTDTVRVEKDTSPVLKVIEDSGILHLPCQKRPSAS
jgi:hypothetical protein